MDKSTEKVMKEGLTYNDVLLVPRKSEVLPREVDLGTRLTNRIRLHIPLISAAMDTVTEARLAVAMAQEGGMGLFTRTCPLRSKPKKWKR